MKITKMQNIIDVVCLVLLLVAIGLFFVTLSGCSNTKSWVKLDVGYSSQPYVTGTFILEK